MDTKHASGEGSSAVVLGTQTASIGGPPVMLENHDVVSLGSSDLNVQMPGGTISTMVSRVNLGGLIASSMLVFELFDCHVPLVEGMVSDP